MKSFSSSLPAPIRRCTILLLTSFCLVAMVNGQVATSYGFTNPPTTSTWSPISGGTQLWNTTFFIVDFNPFDDNISGAQTIPSFTFNGTAYTQMYVSTNGFITFGSAPTATNYTPLSSAETYARSISAVGCDLHNTTNAITSTRDVRWQTVGSGASQEIVVQWRGVRRKNVASEGFAFQIRLQPSTQQIRIVYGPFNQGPGNDATIFPQVGLRGPNNSFATNVNNLQVGAGAETWAAPLAGTANTNTCRLTSSVPAKAWASGLTYTWSPCTPPAVSYSVVENCALQQFSVQANVTNFGYGSSGILSYTVDYGAPTNVNVNSLGITTVGPFPATKIVNLSFRSTASNCGSVGYTAFSACNIQIACGTTTAVTHCYRNFDTRTFTYTNNSPGDAMAITFQSGCLDPADVIAFYDGTDNSFPITFVSGQTDLSGIVVQSMGQSIFMEITSNGSNSCADGGQGCPWIFDVECVAGCQEPNGSVNTSVNCAQNNFSLSVDVSNTGDGATTTLWYSVNGATPTTISGLTAASPDQAIGPFTIGSSVQVKLLHESDGVCDKVLGTFTHNTPCPPANDLCANATALLVNLPAQCPAQATAGRTIDAGTETAAPACAGAGAIRDVWYTFNSGYNISPINIAIAAGTIGNYGVEIYTACGSAPISCTAGNPSVVPFAGAGAFTTYRVRVFTNTNLGAAGTFSICISANPSPTACGTSIADPGGAGAPYADNIDVSATHCPSAASQIMTMTFTSFETEAGGDLLRIYDGPNTSAPLVGTFSGTTLPGAITSTHASGCLTTRFTSNPIFIIFPNTNAGYTANLTCCTGPVPTANASSNGPVCAGSTLQLNLATNIGTLFSWTGPNGFTSAQQNPTIANVTAAAAGTYTVTVRNGASGCPVTTSTSVSVLPNVSVPAAIPTSANICAGTPQALSVSATSSATMPVNSGNGGVVTINSSGAATPYPRNLVVSGLPTSGVTVTSVQINGFSHTFPSDVEMLLRSPLNTNVVLMSDIGDGTDATSLNYVFQDGSPAMVAGALNPSGTYRCSSGDATADAYPAPINSINQTNPLLSGFTGNMNGTWGLYVFDEAAQDGGSITSWSITFSVPATLSYAWTPSGGSMVPANGLAASVTVSPTSSQNYTVTVGHSANACTRQVIVPVTVVQPPNAGNSTSTTRCSNGAVVSLYSLLGGTPSATGTWSGPSALGGGQLGNFTPGTSAPGTYTYTVAPTAPCTVPATATVAVNVTTAIDWYADIDGDGFGNGASTGLGCTAPNAGDVANNTDNCPALSNAAQTNTDGDAMGDACDPDDDNDGISDIAETTCGSNPLVAASTCELCDGVDNDLDSSVDEGFPNTDGDGQADCVDADDDNDGITDLAETACGSNPLIAASTCEVCDGIDNDLDGSTDEGFTNTDGDSQADCVDTDDDDDGLTDLAEAACGSDPLIAASTCEVCDNVDNDLDGSTDEGFVNTDGDSQADCVDTDDDNDGTTDLAETTCGSNPLNAASTCEVCDGADNDLDGSTDEGFTDTDGDGQADCVDSDDDDDGLTDTDEMACGSSHLDPWSRCEVCDGLDNDLDGSTDEGFPNTDGDSQADCVDLDDDNDGTVDTDEIACGSDPLVTASTCEVCDGADNDLDSSTDEGFTNTDGDGQANCVDADDDNDGTSDLAEIACGSDPLVSASTCEVCDGADNDLDGSTDEGFANTDGDGQANCVDTDDDNDGVLDINDNAPLNAFSCQDSDGDGCDDCSVAGTTQPNNDGPDSDGDGICNAGDNCVNTSNANQGNADGDGMGDACDACPNDANNDADGDLLCGDVDSCPNFFGQNGDFCDANPGPGYTLGQITGCACVPVSCTTSLNLVLNPDGVTNIQWELRQQGSNVLVQSGGGIYPPSPEYSLSTCLPNGSFYLVVTSDQPGGGIVQNGVQGGYRLQTTSGVRLVDNSNNFLSGAVSTIAGGQGFDLPIGADRLIYTSCDKVDWRSQEYIVANDNPVVAAYYGGAHAAVTGYEMWFYNPNGGYSFRRFHSHATSDGYAPADPQRACHIKINGWGSANNIPSQALLNVKVRGRIMVGATPTNLPWGPACRFKLDATRAECPLTNLMDVPGSTQLSCGSTRAIGTGAANLVHARPVNRYLNGVSTAANKYQFRFTEEVSVIKTSATGQYWVNTAGLLPCKPYNVEVRASFDNGATWCDTYAAANPYSPKWGRTCVLTTVGPLCPPVNGGNQNMANDVPVSATGQFKLYPNPNNGQQLFISIDMVEEGVQKVSVDIYETFGKRMSTSTIGVNEGYVNTSLDLKGELAAGMYVVNITAGDTVYTERLIIQP